MAKKNLKDTGNEIRDVRRCQKGMVLERRLQRLPLARSGAGVYGHDRMVINNWGAWPDLGVALYRAIIFFRAAAGWG